MLYYVSRLLGQKERFEHFCLDIFSTGLLLQQMTYNNFSNFIREYLPLRPYQALIDFDKSSYILHYD